MPLNTAHPCYGCDQYEWAKIVGFVGNDMATLVWLPICNIDNRIVGHSCKEHTNKGEALAALQRKFTGGE